MSPQKRRGYVLSRDPRPSFPIMYTYGVRFPAAAEGPGDGVLRPIGRRAANCRRRVARTAGAGGVRQHRGHVRAQQPRAGAPIIT
eukprot:922874-Pyramimonas_sp.AAC.1